MRSILAKRRKSTSWRWQEQVARAYLLLFLIIALVGPVTGWLQSPNELNQEQAYQPPFTKTPDNTLEHWLGTDELGRDVVANLVYGARTALLVSLPAMGFATLIGLTLGSMAGYWGDSGFRMRLASFIISLLVLLSGIYYGFYIRQVNWLNAFTVGSGQVLFEAGITILIFLLLGGLGWLAAQLIRLIGFNKQVTVPIDQIILKIIEVVSAIPRLLLIMCLVAFAQPALITIILLAAFTYWTGIARLVRGELLQVKELPFISAARVAGIPESRILFRQALPNALPPVIVAVAFGLGSLMSLETTLSFLGIGIPIEEASWGRLISGFQKNLAAWWLLFFPAFTLCGTILSLQILAARILKQITPARN